jgi:hypothetical protein
VGDNRLEGGNVAFECFPAQIREANSHSASSIGDGSVDLDVTGLLQNAELLGEGGIGHPEAIARKRKIQPVSRRQKRDDGQTRTRVNEFVELGDRHHAPRRCSARRRTGDMRPGPPDSTRAATTALARIAAWRAPSAWAISARTTVTMVMAIRKPKTKVEMWRRLTRSCRTLNLRDPCRPDRTRGAMAA